LIAEDALPDHEIAQLVGVTKRTIERWKKNIIFAERVQEISKELIANALKHKLARIDRRIGFANDVHERLWQIIQARSVDPELANVPGGTTGLIRKKLKCVGQGNNQAMMESYDVDFSLIRELRAIESQVAKEMDRVSKTEEHKTITNCKTDDATDAESIRNKLLEKLMAFQQNSPSEPS
jgi:hypothetical protein